MRDTEKKEIIRKPWCFSRDLIFAFFAGVATTCTLPAFGAELACPELEGDFQPGGLLWGRVAPETSMEFNGVEVPVRRWYVRARTWTRRAYIP